MGVENINCSPDPNNLENRERLLAGKVALITGSSRDIGAEIAIALAREGVCIIGNYREKKKRADGVQEIINSLGIKSEFVQADITIQEDRDKLRQAVEKSFGGKLNFLILNAPVFSEDPTDARSPNEHLTDELLPFMSKGGIIVFMQSVPGYYQPQLREELLNNESIKNYALVAEKKYKDEQSLRKRTGEFEKQGVLFIVVCPPLVEDTSNIQLYFRRNKTGGQNPKFAEESRRISREFGLLESITKAEVGKKVAEVLQRKDLPMGYVEFFKTA